MSCHMLDGAQRHLTTEATIEPRHTCLITGEPIQRGVRIGGAEFFSYEVFQFSDAWVQWYRANAGLSDREIYDLKVEHFSDDGMICTLK